MKTVREIFRDSVPFIERLSKAGGFISGIFIVLLTVLILTEIIMRYGFNRPTSWGVEISEYLMLYYVCIGFAYALLRDKHVRVELLIDHLPQRLKIWLRVFESICGFAFCAILTWTTAEATYSAYIHHWGSPTDLTIPLWPIEIIMPLGFALFGLQFGCKIYHFSQILLRRS